MSDLGRPVALSRGECYFPIVAGRFPWLWSRSGWPTSPRRQRRPRRRRRWTSDNGRAFTQTTENKETSRFVVGRDLNHQLPVGGRPPSRRHRRRCLQRSRAQDAMATMPTSVPEEGIPRGCRRRRRRRRNRLRRCKCRRRRPRRPASFASGHVGPRRSLPGQYHRVWLRSRQIPIPGGQFVQPAD